ncbi:BatD family protein [Candidatus Magnetomonas plexicatena]|uniref:BatD family protein n=1 Tax=Candidatus Magnetomonas plexicatena TaxID=2552947 RepID=UPI00110296CF|nr:protein BatD [Nitrospirales bacterium LBB_01]
MFFKVEKRTGFPLGGGNDKLRGGNDKLRGENDKGGVFFFCHSFFFLSFLRRQESSFLLAMLTIKTLTFILSIFFILITAHTSFASATDPVASVNKDSVAIGEKFTYTISIAHDAEFPDLGSSVDNLTVVSSGTKTSGIFTKVYSKWYVMRGFTVGQYTIPAYTIKYKDGGFLKEAKTPPIRISIITQLPDNATEIADIKGIEDVGWKPIHSWIAAGVLLALALAALIYYLIKRRKLNKGKLPPPLRAHETAYEALRKLHEKNLISAGLIKDYFTELSLIVRVYIENRFFLKAPEMTTIEFLAMVKDSTVLTEAHKALLRDFLNRSDMVKFAKYGPTTDEIEMSFIAAKQFVDQTRETPLAL